MTDVPARLAVLRALTRNHIASSVLAISQSRGCMGAFLALAWHHCANKHGGKCRGSAERSPNACTTRAKRCGRLRDGPRWTGGLGVKALSNRADRAVLELRACCGPGTLGAAALAGLVGSARGRRRAPSTRSWSRPPSAGPLGPQAEIALIGGSCDHVTVKVSSPCL